MEILKKINNILESIEKTETVIEESSAQDLPDDVLELLREGGLIDDDKDED